MIGNVTCWDAALLVRGCKVSRLSVGAAHGGVAEQRAPLFPRGEAHGFLPATFTQAVATAFVGGRSSGPQLPLCEHGWAILTDLWALFLQYLK